VSVWVTESWICRSTSYCCLNGFMSLSRVATGLPWMRKGPGSGCPSAVFMAPHAPRTPPPISEAARPPRPSVAMKSRRPRVIWSLVIGCPAPNPGRVFERLVEPVQSGRDEDEHVGEREADVGDQRGREKARPHAEGVEEEQQRHADGQPGDDEGQQEHSHHGDLPAEPGAEGEGG